MCYFHKSFQKRSQTVGAVFARIFDKSKLLGVRLHPRLIHHQGPSLLKNFEGINLIACVSMTSPCSLNLSTIFL